MPVTPITIGPCVQLRVALQQQARVACATSITKGSGDTGTRFTPRRFSDTSLKNVGLRIRQISVGYGGELSTTTGTGCSIKMAAPTWPTGWFTNSSKIKSRKDWSLTTYAVCPLALTPTTWNPSPKQQTLHVDSTPTNFVLFVERVYTTSPSLAPSTPTHMVIEHVESVFDTTRGWRTPSVDQSGHQKLDVETTCTTSPSRMQHGKTPPGSSCVGNAKRLTGSGPTRKSANGSKSW